MIWGRHVAPYAINGIADEAAFALVRRLLVSHLFLLKERQLGAASRRDRDEPGLWESNGYHIYGDPSQEQRYSGD
jgi:DMSO/TMAO reductase YedYZ molybdopterin-dependent catalytic subunit